MNAALTTLFSLAHKPRTIVGLMSGTSLDGLDIAVCEVSGHDLHTVLKLKHFTSVAYDDEFLANIRPLFANSKASLNAVTKANAWVAREHAAMVLTNLKKWGMSPADVDILASHGQTIFHAPNALSNYAQKTNSVASRPASATLQIGDGDHLAYITKILTLSDFRQKHVAANGEGAPLVPYIDFLLFNSSEENRILLNIGGIANYTYIPANANFNAVTSCDTGPGNTLMDAVILHAHSLSNDKTISTSLPPISKLYDINGNFASKGKVNCELLDALVTSNERVSQNDSPSSAAANASTGQETYNLRFILHAIASSQSPSLPAFPTEEQGFYDLLATLTMFTASTIADAISRLPLNASNKCDTIIYASGGGVHNPALMANIRQNLAHLAINTSNELGIDADAKEAALFAVLANQTLFGSNDIFANNKGIPATSFGKISLP
jgi:anhydro-N-acetylmuramic acid kinase